MQQGKGRKRGLSYTMETRINCRWARGTSTAEDARRSGVDRYGSSLPLHVWGRAAPHSTTTDAKTNIPNGPTPSGTNAPISPRDIDATSLPFAPAGVGDEVLAKGDLVIVSLHQIHRRAAPALTSRAGALWRREKRHATSRPMKVQTMKMGILSGGGSTGRGGASLPWHLPW
jgi:hypothetical protein